MLKRALLFVVSVCFIFTQVIAPNAVMAQVSVPVTGVAAAFTPVLIKGMTIHPEDPFRFDFIVNAGDARMGGDALKGEFTKLIKYFLAALTTPEGEMWVNLSPYEKDRIIPEAFGQTMMGKDLLSLDAVLKQMSSSMTDPAQSLGKDFWDRVYARASAEFGGQEIPVETFNKIWIIPQDVLIYESGNSAFVVRRHMKVMLESDYVAMSHHKDMAESSASAGDSAMQNNGMALSTSGMENMTKDVMRQVVLPAIEQEVNEGKVFANLRQIYHSMVLAAWYKKNLKNTLLAQAYVDQHKGAGVQVDDKDAAQKIYAQYVEAFRRGAYNYIREDRDAVTGKIVPRKYFSGGIPGIREADLAQTTDIAALTPVERRALNKEGDFTIEVEVLPADGTTAKAPFVEMRGVADNAADPQMRITQIDALLSRIGQERQQKGSGDLPRLMVMSDFHGEVRLFLKYIADAISAELHQTVVLDDKTFPAKSIAAQLEAQGVTLGQLKSMKTKFMLLGDFLDRGAFGIKAFWIARELIGLGLAQYVTGNHDLWAFLNLMGFHLPTYEGYEFYGETEAVKEVKWLVKSHWNDADISKDRLAWWTAKLAEYNAHQVSLQGLIFDHKAKDVSKEMKDIYIRNKDNFTSEERLLVEDLVGYLAGGDVYTGFRGVGMMSLKWWESRLARVRAIASNARAREGAVAISIWDDLEQYTAEATRAVEERYNAAMARGEWWWQVFDAINDQNYTSVEWWGKDWSSHDGWGTSVIKELNTIDGTDRWNQANYVANDHLKELARFYRENFTLFLKDEYGNYYTHGWLPVDEKTGEVSFEYKGVTYKGQDVWKGFEIIQHEVRDINTPLPALHEALALVNSFYADKTTRIKPADISKYVTKVGLEKIYRGLGVRTWFSGHNPYNKLIDKGIDFLIKQGDFVHVSTDKGLSWQKYNDLGGYVNISDAGIHLRGFSGPDFREIVDNPVTMTLKKSEDGTYVVEKSFLNKPLAREPFLNLMELQLKEERLRLEASLDNSQAWQGGGINLDPALVRMEIGKDPQGGFLPLKDQPVFNVNINGLIPVILRIVPGTVAVDRSPAS
ncbi:MAG: hypothetical protein HQL17_00520 [Candidatus Omnitrophica bacterium]|nr:hypothetical protein [Candidatus Omnitrophota bacterium]